MRSFSFPKALLLSAGLHGLLLVFLSISNLRQMPLVFQTGQSSAQASFSTPVSLVRPQVQIVLTDLGSKEPRALWRNAGSFSYLADPGMTQSPRAVSGNAVPIYPQVALERGWQGLCLLRAEIDRSGNIQNVILEQSSGYPILDQAALSAVNQWRFVAGSKTLIRIPIRFEIK